MSRLIGALESLPFDELVVQHGFSPRPQRARRAVAFMPFDEMVACFEAANVVITHAGVGSVLSAVRAGHTPIVVPRLRRLGEHVDDHQVELTRALAEHRAVTPVWDVRELPEAVASYPVRRDPYTHDGELAIHYAVGAALRGESARRD